ncbi:MAG: hypothetical protein ABI847_08800, partial [Anaerolineales bacterium]
MTDPEPARRPRWRGTALAAVASVLLAAIAAAAALSTVRTAEPKSPAAGVRAYFPIYYQANTNTPSPTPAELDFSTSFI